MSECGLQCLTLDIFVAEFMYASRDYFNNMAAFAIVVTKIQ